MQKTTLTIISQKLREIKADPNQNPLFQMAVPLKTDPMFVKPKGFFQFVIIFQEKIPPFKHIQS